MTKPWQDRVFIDKRPSKINLRREIGHAEADFIVSGKSGRGILLVVVDRKLRISFLERILALSQQEVTWAFERIQLRYSELRTITTDNDILLQHHKKLEQKLGVCIYFCHPGHAWEKGQVENANKWIRRYITKGSDISKYSRQFVGKLEAKINRRIMHVLGYRRPQEILKSYRKRKKRRGALQNQKK